MNQSEIRFSSGKFGEGNYIIPQGSASTIDGLKIQQIEVETTRDGRMVLNVPALFIKNSSIGISSPRYKVLECSFFDNKNLVDRIR